MIKLYCRELPEPILTNKLSEILVLIQESEQDRNIFLRETVNNAFKGYKINGDIEPLVLVSMAILHDVLLCSFHLSFPPSLLSSLVSSDVPSQVRLPALQAIMLLMPDEHREALEVLLLFLREVASYSGMNQVRVMGRPQNDHCLFKKISADSASIVE